MDEAIERAVRATCECYGPDVTEDALAAAAAVPQEGDRHVYALAVAAAVADVLTARLEGEIKQAQRATRLARLTVAVARAERQPVTRAH